MPKDEKPRKRMVVEEVGAASEVVNPEPVTEIKEKVEELQSLTENISQSVEKSEAVEEQIASAAEQALPEEPQIEQDTPAPMPRIKNGNGPNPLIIIIPGIFLLGALLGGIFFYQRGISGESAQPTPTLPTYNNVVTPAPSPSSGTQIDLTKYPINIMNGSGIAGQAGVVKDLLTSAGFTVKGTGNASSYDFTKTVIKAKADVPAAFLTQLSTTLSKSYVLDANESLATSSADDVQVIVGSTKAK